MVTLKPRSSFIICLLFVTLGVGHLTASAKERSGIIHDLSFAFSTDTTIHLPQAVEVSLYHEINDQWAVLGTANWEQWSEFGSILISTAQGGAQVPRGWRDTFKLAGGVHYRLSPLWLLKAGMAYDSSPVGASERTADMPIDRQFRYAVGAQYQYSEALSLGGALEYLDLGEARINSSQLMGEYDKNRLFFISFNGNFKLL